jgi:hypothetical protein
VLVVIIFRNHGRRAVFVVQGSGPALEPKLKSAYVTTLIRNLADIAQEDREPHRGSPGMGLDGWKRLREVRFFPRSSGNAKEVELTKASSLCSPQHHRFCFTILDTVSKDFLRTFGNKALLRVFRQLGVSEELDLDVLVSHVIQAAKLTAQWVDAFNAFSVETRESLAVPGEGGDGIALLEKRAMMFEAHDELGHRLFILRTKDAAKAKKVEERLAVLRGVDMVWLDPGPTGSGEHVHVAKKACECFYEFDPSQRWKKFRDITSSFTSRTAPFIHFSPIFYELKHDIRCHQLNTIKSIL